MTKKKKGQVKFIVITEDDSGLRMDWEEGLLSISEVIGMLEFAKMTLQKMICHHQAPLAQQQEEAK